MNSSPGNGASQLFSPFFSQVPQKCRRRRRRVCDDHVGGRQLASDRPEVRSEAAINTLLMDTRATEFYFACLVLPIIASPLVIASFQEMNNPYWNNSKTKLRLGGKPANEVFVQC